MDSQWSSRDSARTARPKRSSIMDKTGGVTAHPEWTSTPPPPLVLWDTDDADFLEKVSCNAIMRLNRIDPQESTYSLRLKCYWTFRTQHTGDRTETKLRVPGLRAPGLQVKCEESRIWRVLAPGRLGRTGNARKGSDKTVLWKGTSLFHINGFEIFEMRDFPFDRQLIHLELLEFVWKTTKDADDYDFSMKLVRLKLVTESFMPNWKPFPAIVTAENDTVVSEEARLSFASRFQVQLKIERRHLFHVIQTFGVTTLITVVAACPLALPTDLVAQRISAYAIGILTLVKYKYTITHQLPQVSYMTFADFYLLGQIFTILALAVESLIIYRLSDFEEFYDATVAEIFEVTSLVIVLIIWTVIFLHTYMIKKRRDWQRVLDSQEDIAGVTEADAFEDV